MFEYNDAVARAYTVEDNGVGGSLACRDAIRQGHHRIEIMLREGAAGLAEIERRLNLSDGALRTRAAQQAFLGNGVAQFPAQENDPACEEPACNIGKICAIMLNTSLGDELDRLVKLREVQNPTASWVDVSSVSRYPGGVDEGPLPDFWFYQTCKEFGFYQTCSVNSSCMFVRGLIDIASEAGGCEDYGLSISDVGKNIEATNLHYGGLTPLGPTRRPGSCVLWPNGEVDPWATLSVLVPPKDAQQATLWIPGASHHAWTRPSAEADQSSVVAARASIREYVRGRLAESCREDDAEAERDDVDFVI